MGLCQIFFKAFLAGLTNQRDISDSFAVTPLSVDELWLKQGDGCRLWTMSIRKKRVGFGSVQRGRCECELENDCKLEVGKEN